MARVYKQKVLLHCKKCGSGFIHYTSNPNYTKTYKTVCPYCYANYRKLKAEKPEKELDKLWVKAVRKTSGKFCSYCGLRTNLQCAHIVSRRFHKTRWGAWVKNGYDLNGILLCQNCHENYDRYTRWRKKIIKHIGIKRYKELNKIATSKLKLRERTYEEIKSDLKNLLE